MKSYIMVVRFTVGAGADEHLQTTDGIKDEVTSSLESVGATVQTLTIDEDEEVL